MATKYWIGQAPKVAKEMRATPSGVIDIGDSFSLACGGVTICTFVATAGTVANVTAGLTAAWNASTHPYAIGITASDQTTYTRLLADVPGVEFTVTSSAVGATLTMSTPTANAGPCDWSSTGNWSDGVVPVNTDIVHIRDWSGNICYGLNQSAVSLNGLFISQTFTGKLGLDYAEFTNSADGNTADATVQEYRDTYLRISVAQASGELTIGEFTGVGTPRGSGRILVDLGSNAATVIVRNTAANASEQGRPCVRLKGVHASNNLFVVKSPGGVGIAVDKAGETSTWGEISISQDPVNRVYCGRGVTLTTFEQGNGINVLQATGTVTAVIATGGDLRTEGAFAITNCYNYGADLDLQHNTSGTDVTTLYAYGGVTDGSRNPAGITIGTTVWGIGGTIIKGPNTSLGAFTTPVDRVWRWSMTL